MCYMFIHLFMFLYDLFLQDLFETATYCDLDWRDINDSIYKLY